MGYGRRLLRALLGASLVAMVLVSSGPAQAAYTECSTPATPLPNAKKILITGDSATHMSTGDYTWRYFLWQHFAQHSTPVDFQGSWDGTFDYIGRSNDNSHDYAMCDFDWDHEARAGAKISEFNAPTPATSDPMDPNYPGKPSWISGAVQKYSPDVVIEFAGFNDLLHYEEDHGNVAQGSIPNATMANAVVAQAHTYVQTVQNLSPNTDLLLATVPSSKNDRYSAYNAALKTAAASWSTATSKVIVVDLTPWSPNHSWDGWHPDGQADAGIAAQFAAAFHTLDPATYPAADPVPTVAIGPRQPAVITGATTPANNQVALTWTNSPDTNRDVILGRDVTANPDPSAPWTTLADLLPSYYKITYGIGTDSCDYANPCTSYTLTGLAATHQYQFKIESGKVLTLATDAASISNVVTATPTGTPPPPKAGKVALPGTTALEHAVKVTWAAVPNASGYQVYWRKQGVAAWSGPSAVGAVTTKTISGLTPGVVYQFAVRATQTGATAGDLSDVKTSGVRAYALATPAKPKVVSVAGHKLKATWGKITHASRYLVQVKLAGKVVKSVFVTTPSYTSPALKKGKTYTVQVRPYDGAYAGAGTSPAGSLKVK